MSGVSTLGVELASIARLGKSQSTMANLNQQLCSGLVSTNLSDYSSTDAKNLVDLNSSLSRKKAYVDVASLIDTRISIYDSSLTGIEDVGGQAVSLCSTSTDYNSQTNSTTAETLKSYMQQVEYYLNQESGGRYVFSGTRYTTAPVTSLTDLPTLTTTSTTSVVSSPSLPEYDTEYVDSTSYSASAYVQDTVSLDTTVKMTYGISSDDTSFQTLVLGLRYAYAATQDATNYQTLMNKGQLLIQQGLAAVQAIHTTLSSNGSTLSSIKANLADAISTTQTQVSNIQSVDTNEVSVKITSMETQIDAAYSATAKLLDLSILTYL